MTVHPARRTGRVGLSASLFALGAVVALPALPASAVGSTWYVDNQSAVCTDTGAGTQATPFCTISAGAKKAVNAGDTVLVSPGTYREQVTVAGSGTASDPVRISGTAPGVILLGTNALNDAAGWTSTGTTAWSRPYAPPSNPRQVLLDDQRLTAAGSATTTTNGSYFFDATAKVLYVDIGGANPAVGHTVEAGAQSYGVNVASRHDVVVSGFEARGQNFAGFRVFSSTAVTVQDVTSVKSASNGVLVDGSLAGVVIRRADVSKALSTGIRVAASTGTVVSGSTSHDNGLHGIGLSTSPSTSIVGNTVFGNVSLNPNATAVGIDVNTSSPDALIRGNIAHDNEDSGVQVYSSSARALVVRNVSYRNGDHGFDTLNAVNARYIGNTAYKNRRDGISVEGTSTGATLANNILVDNGLATNEYDLYVDPGSVSGFTADHDLAYNTTPQPEVRVGSVVYATLPEFAAATGQESHGLSKAPGFVDVDANDFRLVPGSPAVDAADATVTGFDPVDLLGNSPVDDPNIADRGVGSPTYADLGAYEQPAPAGSQDYPPIAALIVNPPTIAAPPGRVVTADASGSSDSDSTGIVSYTFDFGDGTVVGPQSAATATHVFDTVGTYDISVRVSDGGASATATGQEVVTARPLVTYRVEQTSAACSDSGPGTVATPFCSISAAAKVALAGDTVLVGQGAYREQVRLTAGGTPAAPVTYRATSSNTVVLGSKDVSDGAGWTATTSSAWRHSYSPVSTPTQVFLDGKRLAQAPSATATTAGSWYYDAAGSMLYVDIGGANPASGHTVAAGSLNFGFLVRQVDNVVIDGFSVRQQNLTPVYLDRVDRTTISNLTVSQGGSHGLTVDSSTRVSVDHLMTQDNASTGARFFDSADSSLSASVSHDNGFHGVSLQSSRRVVVSDVDSYANVRPGSRVATGIDVSQGSVDCVVERSTTHGNDDSGIEAYTGSTGTVIRRNLSYDNGDHGIDNSSAAGSVVLSNTVVGNQTAGINLEGGSSGALLRDNIAMNNAVGSTRTIGEIRIDESSEPGISLDRDLVFQSSGGTLFEWSSQPYTTLAGFQAVSGQEPAGLAQAPQFADLAGRDLRLTGGSPAIDAADARPAGWIAADRNGASPVDHPGVPDTGSGAPPYADLGALEFSGPVARMTLSASSGLAPQQIDVDARASAPLGAPLTSFRVDCGNGTSATGAQSQCTYPAGGTFAITVSVTDSSGQQDSVSRSVTITGDSPPVARLSASPTQGWAPQAVTLDASASTDTDKTPIAGFAFDCGNGQTRGSQASATFSCSYTAAGTYSASTTVRDTAGLTATATVSVSIQADQPPTARITASPSQAYVPQVVTLSASGSTDTDNTPIAGYAFDCGNGQSRGSEASPTFSCSYTAAGTYSASTTVRDTAGLTRTVSTTVRILADVPPNAVIDLSSTRIKRYQSVTVSGERSTSVDNSPIATYRFDCGNGLATGERTSPTFTCQYVDTGNYTVRIWVKDTVGLVDTASDKLQVRR